MGEKKHEGRYTIQFNLQDTPQRKASRILDKQGRHKAQFLTSVILYYEQHVKAMPLHQTALVDDEELERRVLGIMERLGIHSLQKAKQMSGQSDKSQVPLLEGTNDPSVDHEAELDMDTMSAIKNTLLAFEGN